MHPGTYPSATKNRQSEGSCAQVLLSRLLWVLALPDEQRGAGGCWAHEGTGKDHTSSLTPPAALLLPWLLLEPLEDVLMVLLLARALLLRRCRVRRRLLKRSPTSSFLFISSFSARLCSLPTASASISSSSSLT